jgi:hypothetical protein
VVYNGEPVFSAAGVQTAAVGTVWQKTPVTSGDYGNLGGGDITYIGPCDANTPGGASNWNYVALVLNQIQVPNNQGSLGTNKEFLDDQFTALTTATPAGDGDADFENPCPSAKPCVLKFQCKENQDVGVSFNLTVMRDANQGFFDIAVNFEDVFCSAKLDTCYPDPDNAGPKSAEAIKLLFGSNGRDETAVAALACTVGPDTATKPIATRLLFTKAQVVCDAATFVLGLSSDAGTGKVATSARAGTEAPYHLQYGLFYGDEQLSCGTVPGAGDLPARDLSCNKVYFNIAVDIAELAAQGLTNCQFFWGATAVEKEDKDTFTAQGRLADKAGVYAGVGFGRAAVGEVPAAGVPLTGAATLGVSSLVCDGNPLNGENFGKQPSAVRTRYLAGDDFSGGNFVTGVKFDYRFDAPDKAVATP